MATTNKSWLNGFIALRRNFCLYWKIFGGNKALFTSPNLYIAILLSGLSYRFYNQAWYDLPIGIVPNILGFTLGGYAVILSFGGEGFYKVISMKLKEDGDKPTPFMTFNGAFVHFIVIQILTLLYSLIGKVFCFSGILGFIGVFFMYYTVLTALAAVFAIMNLAHWFEELSNHNNKK